MNSNANEVKWKYDEIKQIRASMKMQSPCIQARACTQERPQGSIRTAGLKWEGGITKSERGQGWQGPLWVTQSNPLPKQGHPEQAAQHRGQAGLEYLQRRRLHRLPGQPVPGLRHPQREEVLPHVQLELPLLQFVPIAPQNQNLELQAGKLQALTARLPSPQQQFHSTRD